jgi:nitrite reductase/ring-hydroxylating ferredoxin subunit
MPENRGLRLAPFPTGWYAVAFSDELRPRQVMPATLAGRELVIYRTASGLAAAMEATCPHLGAHLGYGGTVDGELLRCPFHGFRFATDGECASTPYRQSAVRLQASVVAVHETQNTILAWHDQFGRPPGWRVPDVDMSGWPAWITRKWTITGHPQETTENSVDLGHLTELHGYLDVAEAQRYATDGPHLTIGYRARRRFGPVARLPLRIRITVNGLGHSYVQADLPGIYVRQLVLASPLDGRRIQLRIAMSIRLKHGHHIAGKSLERLIGAIAMRQFAHDVQQDFPIWEHKAYINPPRLVPGDGPIGHYRRWARQFYVDGRGASPDETRSVAEPLPVRAGTGTGTS